MIPAGGPSPAIDPSERLARGFARLAACAGAIVIAIGTLALVSWLIDMPTLRSGLWSVTVKSNAAVCLVLSGAGLVLLRPTRADRVRKSAGRCCALAVILIGSLTLTQHLFRWNLGIDQLLFREAPGAAATSSPNRMGIPASTCFPLLGTALLLLDVRTRSGIRPSQYLALITAVISSLPCLGYLYGADELYRRSDLTGIAFPTAVSFVILATGTFFARQDGMVALLCAADEGGWIARRVLPVALFVPLGIGWFCASAERGGNYDAPFALALMALVSTLVLVSLIWWNANRTSKNSRARVLSELARNEIGERLGDIVENMKQGFLALDSAHRIELVNREMERLLGLGRTDLIGKKLADVMDKADGESLGEACARAATNGTPVAYEQKSARHGVWLHSDIVPQRYGLTIFSRDITEERRGNEERLHLLASERVARADAERLNRIKDEFLATLSHELRTPLNAILGWTQVMQKRAPPAGDLHDGLATIERNARSQSRLIDDLLDMSRIISGKLRLDIQPVDLAAVISSAVQTVRPGAEAKEIRLQTTIDPRATSIAGDHARLQQVVWNLLSNAVKFTPKGGRVQVQLSRSAAHVEIRVTDSGTGIAPEFLPFVFDRFRQADASTTRRQSGLGLGLAIVRHLSELHGGSVSADSEGEGRGATFTVRLPVALAPTLADAKAAEVDRSSAARAAAPARGETSLSGLRVLVVEDQDDARELVQRLLEEAGAEVVTASGGQKALDLVKERAPDAIVSDIAMPEFDGYELIRSVRALPADAGGGIPAIALTALARAEDREQALQAGFQAHVSKPVHGAELISVVAELSRRTPSS